MGIEPGLATIDINDIGGADCEKIAFEFDGNSFWVMADTMSHGHLFTDIGPVVKITIGNESAIIDSRVNEFPGRICGTLRIKFVEMLGDTRCVYRLASNLH